MQKVIDGYSRDVCATPYLDRNREREREKERDREIGGWYWN